MNTTEEVTITLEVWQWREVMVDLDCLEGSEELESGSISLRHRLRLAGVEI